ncbi:MAG: acyl carrier protein [Bradyrhizobium sp.]
MLDVAERTIAERVRTIVVDQLVVDPENVVDSASFIDDLGADSLDMVEMAIKFEREFGFEITDESAESILTVGDAVKFLEKHAIA